MEFVAQRLDLGVQRLLVVARFLQVIGSHLLIIAVQLDW